MNKTVWMKAGLVVVLLVTLVLGYGGLCQKADETISTGSSATKDVAGLPENELSLLMHQQAQTLPAPVIPQQSAQKSIITTSAVNPDLPFTVVALDEFYRPTDTIKANVNDVVYIELQGVTAGYYNGAILVQTTGADIISIEESYDYWWNGIGLWWTPTSADQSRGGAGWLYYYDHFHSSDNDTYKSEGSSWCAAWEAEGVQYGYDPGPAGSLVTGTPVSEARFYFSGYLGNHSATRPGLRLGLKLKDTFPVGINISGHNRYEFNWLNLAPVYSGTITVAPRVNYQSVHNEGENAWIQVSCPENAYVGDTISVTAYGELMMDANEYNASVERIDSLGATTVLTDTGIAAGNEFGPVSFSYEITHASEDKAKGKMQSGGAHPGQPVEVEGKTTLSKKLDKTWPIITITSVPPFNADNCINTTGDVEVTITAEDPEVDGEICSGLKEFKYQYFKNDVPQVGVTTPPNPSVTITLSGDARYKIKAWASDNATPTQHDTEKEQDIIIDSTRPVVNGQEIFEPGNTKNNTVYLRATRITITKTIVDTSGASQVEVEITGTDVQGNEVTATRTVVPTVVGRVDNKETIQVTVDLPDGVVDGEVSITEKITDKAGNTSIGKDFNAFLDRIAPELEASRTIQPNYGKWYNKEIHGLIKVRFTASDKAPSSGIALPNPNPKDFPFSQDGEDQKAECQAVDNAGNTSGKKEEKVSIDKTDPNIDARTQSIDIEGQDPLPSSDSRVTAIKEAAVTDVTSKIDWSKTTVTMPAILPWGRRTEVTVTAVDKELPRV